METTITVGSVTYAIKLRKLLLKANVDSELVKISDKEAKGCTHGVKINSDDYFRAIMLLRQNGIEYSVLSGK